MKLKKDCTRFALIILKLIICCLAIDATGSTIDYLISIHLQGRTQVHNACILAFYPLQYLIPFLTSVYTYNYNISTWSENYCSTVSKTSLIASIVFYIFYESFFFVLLIDICLYLLDYLIRYLEQKYKRDD